jgi:hypothetical protein
MDIIGKNPNSLKKYEDDSTSTTVAPVNAKANAVAKNKEKIEEKKAEVEEKEAEVAEREAELAKREANIQKKLAAPPPPPPPPPEQVTPPPPPSRPPPPPPAKKPLTIKKISGVTEHDPVKNPNGSYKGIVTNHSGQSYSIEAKSLAEVQSKMNTFNKKGENVGDYVNRGYSNNIVNGGGKKSKTKRLVKKYKDT